MVRGDHIYVRRGRRYTHHGIDCGDGSVIHYIGRRTGIRRVGRTPFEDFAAGSRVRVRRYRHARSAEETLRTAESLIGTTDYHLIRNNCEHFAVWCRTGRSRSRQVRRWFLAALGTTSVAIVQTPGLHIVLIGLIGAGLFAITRPRAPWPSG